MFFSRDHQQGKKQRPLSDSCSEKQDPRGGLEPGGHGCGPQLLPQTSREGLCEGVRVGLAGRGAALSLDLTLVFPRDWRAGASP